MGMLLLPPALAVAQGSDEQYNVTIKMAMVGIPMEMPAISQRLCVKKGANDGDFVPRQENCTVSDAKRVGAATDVQGCVRRQGPDDGNRRLHVRRQRLQRPDTPQGKDGRRGRRYDARDRSAPRRRLHGALNDIGRDPMTATAAMIGAGLIGRSWAMVFARAGWQCGSTTALRRSSSGARAHRKRTRRAAGVRTRRRRGGCRADRLRRGPRVRADGRGLGAGERAGNARREAGTLSRIDRAAPPAGDHRELDVGIPASQFTEHLAGRARCIVAHPVNPPHLVPIVELSPAPWTDAGRGRARARAARRRSARCRSW